MPSCTWFRGGRLCALALSLSLVQPLAAAASNLGFEQGEPGFTAPGWTLEAVDSAVVVTGEGAADFTVYADHGIEVPPLFGAQMLRLGTPKQVNESQSRGANAALSDPFELADRELTVTFRLFSLEHRGDDRLTFEVLDGNGQPISASFALEPVLPRPSGAVAIETITSGCSAGTACELAINIGRRDKRPADTGAYRLTFTVAESLVGQPVRLRYTVAGGGNEAHASWAYFDSANRSPRPQARVNPGSSPDFPALEGDFVVADCLQTVDPDGDDFQCDWRATGGGLDAPKTASGRVAVFWFPDDRPAPVIELTVTDALGDSASETRTVYVENAQPVVSAIHAETLAGQPATTVCRFADAGIGRFGESGAVSGQEESHDFVGTAEVVGAAEEFAPSFSSGYFALRADSSGTCTVADKDGSSGSDPYEIRVIDPTTLASRLGDETRAGGAGGNDSFDAAHDLEVGWKYLAAIGDPADIDVYRVVRQGASLAPGSELVVTLDDLPADYDLLVFSNGGSTAASPFFNAPFFNAPFFNAPFFNAPFFNAPFFNAQFDSVPFFNAPFFNAPFFNAPFFNAPLRTSPFFNASNPGGPFNRAFTDLPLSQVGLAAPDGSQISNSDISVTELGSLSLGALQAVPGISLKALSAEPGTGDEKVLVTVSPGESELYVVVAGNQNAFSAADPYALMLEASTPPSQERLLADTGFCEVERSDPEDPDSPPRFAATWLAAGDPPASAGATLILTQRERFEVEQADSAARAVASGAYPDEAAFWSGFWGKIDEYAARVGGTVVSIDGSIYEAADRRPCSVAVRNDLARTIRDRYIVQPGAAGATFRSPELQAVVIVGGQNVVPVHAVPDETVVGNERDFTTDLWVRPGTPLSVAAAEGYNLTDAAYVDLEPTPFRGRALYLEDVPVARLVESPEAITGDLDAFLYGSDNRGRLAMGYDFFCDGTAETAELLGVTPINGPPCESAAPWTADVLRQEYLAGGAPMCLATDAPAPLELAVVNAHMTTYAALSAAGFESGTASPPLAPGFADTVASTESAQCLAGTTTATIGCHSGLNVPGAWALPPELGLPFDAARDWVEELGNLVAPRGYGLGDNTVANRGTEGIITLMFEALAEGATLGDALVTAKRRYVMSLRELDVHDEDSLINLALFGPPQLTFALPGANEFSTSSGTALATSGVSTLELKLLEGNGDGTERYLLGSPTSAAAVAIDEKLDADRGRWFELSPGTAQATYGRPLLPATLPVEDRLVAPGDTRIHGVALVSRDAPQSPCPIDGTDRPCSVAARYVDLDDADGDGVFDFNPVFPLPQHDWVVPGTDPGAREPALCVETLAPTQLGVASTLDTGLEVRQSLVVGAGQFRCEAGETDASAPGQVLGQHRLYQALQLTALHPVGESDAVRQARDADYDPPQVTRQTVISNPDDGSVTATLRATDALTGGSGIREIIALVYWEGDDTGDGIGAAESYSATPAGALTAEPFEHTFVLEQARGKRLAFQYVDGAGNLTQKSLKGSLFVALDVDILTTLVTATDTGSVSVRVGDYCKLESPQLALRIDDGATLAFPVESPPPGITVDVQDPGDPSRPCDRVLVISGIDFTASGGDAALTLTVEVQGSGAFGSDTEVLTACVDPDEPEVADEADIRACAFRVDASDVVVDMFIAGVISADVQYRVELPDLGAQFKYFQLGKTSAAKQTTLEVNVVSSTMTGSQLEFRISGLSKLGWSPGTPLRFRQATQSGVPGEPGQGFPDETLTFTGQ